MKRSIAKKECRLWKAAERTLALLLTAVVLLQVIPITTAADGEPCPHHQEHTATCGYMEPVECTCPTNEEGVQTHVEDGCPWTEGSKCTFPCPVCPIEEKINQLSPEQITQGTGTVAAQAALAEIDAAVAALPERLALTESAVEALTALKTQVQTVNTSIAEAVKTDIAAIPTPIDAANKDSASALVANIAAAIDKVGRETLSAAGVDLTSYDTAVEALKSLEETSQTPPEQEPAYYCGKEAHTHSAENGCYDSDGTTLTCEKEEHTHTEACQTPPKQEPTYYCEKEAHTHSVENGCYDSDGRLTCEKEEHTHTEDCQTPPKQEPEYTCGLDEHTHSVENGCYAENGTTLTCQQTEHTHTSLCLLAPEDRARVQAVIDLIDALPTKEEIDQTFTALLEAEDEEGYEAALIDLILKVREAYDAYAALSDELKLEVTNVDKLRALEEYRDGLPFADNPEFTVQYYANLPVAATNGENGALTLIDTTDGKLPQNGVLGEAMPTKKLYLTQASNSKYEVAMTSALTEVYKSYAYEFTEANELQHIDRLAKNGNYALKAIWVLTGNDATSTNAADWKSYDPETAEFTNNPAYAQMNENNIILIEEGTVIRLVYDTTNSAYTNAVNFYDYDITDGNGNTIEKGINSAANYNGSGVKLAFGNVNTGTGLGSLTWNGNYINKYNGSNSSNQHGYLGCAFGLVTGLDSNGNIVYSRDIAAPKLFNDGDAIGKTYYTNGQYNLQFNREGDTYTLSSVGGSNVSGLEYFNHPVCGSTTHKHIWTNNFWPMDDVEGADEKTGELNNEGQYTGVNGTKDYPVSDDGIAHNNMFGMQYAVQFDLTEDYVGPLEYYFFGDDDMWVFLDGELICDIGGVHSSVGEYVNLWDYIKKGSESSVGKHTLSFYYTERGLSGSTCYMRFTLPSVSSATPGQKVGSLRVEKKVTGQNTNQEFQFTLNLSNDNEYSYNKYNANGDLAYSGTIANNGTFSLYSGQYIVVNNLPYNTDFKITETAVEGCTVTNTVNGVSSQSRTAEGTIGGTNQSVTVLYTNRMDPKMPDTGGEGVAFFTMGGLLLSCASLLLLYRRRYGAHSHRP